MVTGPRLNVPSPGGPLTFTLPPARFPYVLEYTDGIGSGHVWTPVGATNNGTGGEVAIPIDLPTRARLFRIRVP